MIIPITEGLGLIPIIYNLMVMMRENKLPRLMELTIVLIRFMR